MFLNVIDLAVQALKTDCVTLSITAGTSQNLMIKIYDEEGSLVVPPAGSKMRMSVKKYLEDSSTAFDVDFERRTDYFLGLITMPMTEDLTPGRYYYNVIYSPDAATFYEVIKTSIFYLSPSPVDGGALWN